MSGTKKFRDLKVKERAVVSLAVILDAGEAVELLAADAERGAFLSKAAKELALLPDEVRDAYIGSALRDDLKKLASGKS